MTNMVYIILNGTKKKLLFAHNKDFGLAEGIEPQEEILI